MAEARLPGLSATLVHTSWEHRSAFHAFVRSATAGRRAACLLATGAALGWLGGWDTSLLALLSVGCTSELSSGVKDPTLELFVYFAWLAALGLLSSLLVFDPRARVTVAAALGHPFVAAFCGDEGQPGTPHGGPEPILLDDVEAVPLGRQEIRNAIRAEAEEFHETRMEDDGP